MAKKSKKKAEKLKIIPLGGMHEIGKNLTVFEYGEDIIIVDCGMAFPDDEMLGIDVVIPDVSYLVKNIEKIRGIVLTHGHEDHIGALPYFLRDINVPVFGTRLTLGIVKNKLNEHGMGKTTELMTVSAGEKLELGCFTIEFIRSNHSIPDPLMLAITTPAGTVIHTGDFKIDPTPIQSEMIDLARLGELGKKGVLLLMSDSTNACRPGISMSESRVGDSFENIFKNAGEKRIIVATFSSNVHRIQQIIDAAARHGRKVAISGRSMVNITNVSMELGYMDVPEGIIIDIDSANRMPDSKVVIVTTGSQGEPMSALYRMAFSDHKKLEAGPNDLIVISASPIPGNEKMVSRVVNALMRSGAEVMYEALNDIHASGHACQEEQKIILALTKPQFFMPVHGEYLHLKKHASLAKAVGVAQENIFILENGNMLEINADGAKINGKVQSGRVLVDGLGVGDVSGVVLRDRKHLAQDGLIVIVATIDSSDNSIIAGPEVVSRGFVYMREAEDLMEHVRMTAKQALTICAEKNMTEWNAIKSTVKSAVSDLLYTKTKRSPMILTVITEI